MVRIKKYTFNNVPRFWMDMSQIKKVENATLFLSDLRNICNT